MRPAIGQRVRVAFFGEGSALIETRRGLVSLVHADESTSLCVDVDLDDEANALWLPMRRRALGDSGLELEKVDVATRLQCLSEEERRFLDGEGPVGHLTLAQELIAKRDFRSAREVLSHALRNLSGTDVSVGSTCVTFCEAFTEKDTLKECKLGMVSLFDEISGSVELMSLSDSDDDKMEEDDEFVVPMEELLPVPAQPEACKEFLLLALKNVKLCLQQQDPEVMEAVRLCAVSVCLCDHVCKDEEDLLFEFLILKTRAHIIQAKLLAASIDIRRAVLMRPQNLQARQYVRILQQRKKFQQSKNKTLAREVSMWIDTAIRTNELHECGDRDEDSAGEGGIVGWLQSNLL